MNYPLNGATCYAEKLVEIRDALKYEGVNGLSKVFNENDNKEVQDENDK